MDAWIFTFYIGLWSNTSLFILFAQTGKFKYLEQGKYKLNDPVYKYLPEFKQMRVSSIEKN